ncbi:nuclear transport factor 2 family protein [Microbacterium sp. CFH 31415]|uniref:nuclear transport factor 2 family protein n=1 Tax=Microbacterium sp. CFH 31415 TaxID=2921732 RepID=UPI001F133D58|nr:nuclear transport factor 2 family protein [Microbacterium sp. CFH 31415]MCH6229410.1 nuclear transport factor 2 family protein [Microbacterium sp. CFH 31415]
MARTGREVVEALIATLNAGDVGGMDDLFHEDAVMEWPQSGERIVGGDNRRAVYTRFPQLPAISLRRLIGDGDVWVAQADLDYGDGDPYQSIFIFELRDGRIAQETAYWTKPFPAPDWRAEWVERM